ncbi:MAG: hypothetical protein HRT89_09375 [Lentisphaeria bacterium]|nr:hypothetical protein [Lentisphaeria bacterium]NQZ68270.1 hypothetical protein [Lentisphaeria bacterium]
MKVLQEPITDCLHDDQMCYGTIFPFQVGPNLAAVYLNIHWKGPDVVDLDNGADVILFDRWDAIDPARAVSICRSTVEQTDDPEKTILQIRRVFSGGFVPLDAKLSDGSAHPHAGTGFGLMQVHPYNADSAGIPLANAQNVNVGMDLDMELYQVSCDGQNFQVNATSTFVEAALLEGLSGCYLSLVQAIPDGPDLLCAITANRPGASSCAGVCRWRRIDDCWQPIAFTPVVDFAVEEMGIEASLIRDSDEALLFTIRGLTAKSQHRLTLWRSTDGDEWTKTLDVGPIRGQAPLTLNRTASGMIYFLGSKLSQEDRPVGMDQLCTENRNTLCLWPVTESRDAIAGEVVIQDCITDFGPPPSGKWWRADHAVGASLVLEDTPYELIAYRLIADAEIMQAADMTPFTGAYMAQLSDL